MKNKIGKIHKELFLKCQGTCQSCMNNKNCQLVKMIKKYGLDHIKNLVYNENKKTDIPIKIKQSVGRPRLKKKRGRPRKIKVSSAETLKQAKEIMGKGKHRGFVYLNCKKCKKEDRIHTNNKELYTEEIKKNWVCIVCKPARRR